MSSASVVLMSGTPDIWDSGYVADTHMLGEQPASTTTFDAVSFQQICGRPATTNAAVQ